MQHISKPIMKCKHGEAVNKQSHHSLTQYNEKNNFESISGTVQEFASADGFHLS